MATDSEILLKQLNIIFTRRSERRKKAVTKFMNKLNIILESNNNNMELKKQLQRLKQKNKKLEKLYNKEIEKNYKLETENTKLKRLTDSFIKNINTRYNGIDQVLNH